MKYIASANYRGRHADKKWLVREKSKDTSKAKEASTVLLTGMKFVRSDKEERGFGCRIVAECNSAEVVAGGDYAAYSERVRFDGVDFYTGEDSFNSSRYVTSATEFLLWFDGTMWMKPAA